MRFRLAEHASLNMESNIREIEVYSFIEALKLGQKFHEIDEYGIQIAPTQQLGRAKWGDVEYSVIQKTNYRGEITHMSDVSIDYLFRDRYFVLEEEEDEVMK